MAWQSGGGGYPGVVTDGQTPGGLLVSGEVVLGNQDPNNNPGSIISHGTIAGFWADDGDGGDHVVQGGQVGNLQADNFGAALFGDRFAANLNGHSYLEAVVVSRDETPSPNTAPLYRGYDHVTKRFEVNKAGGVGLFGHATPTAPRTLAQSVITAIADANAQTAVQAVANALSDMGALTLT